MFVANADCHLSLKLMHKAEGVTRLGKCLPCKHEDPSSGSRIHVKEAQRGGQALITLVLRRRQEDPWTHWPVSLAELVTL